MRTSLPVIFAVALLAGCGKAAHPRAGAATQAQKHTRAKRAGRPSGPLTGNEASAFEGTVALRPGDLPGFRETHEPKHQKTAAEKRAGEALRRCVGAPAQKHGSRVVERESPEFTREGALEAQTFSSSVEVLPSTSLAKRELVFVRRSHTAACVSRYLTSQLGRMRRRGASIGPVRVRAFRQSAPGTAGGFGWRVAATISTHGVKFHLRFDLLGFAYRSAFVTLFDIGFPSLPEAQEQRLFSLLIARARSFPNQGPASAPAAPAQAA